MRCERVVVLTYKQKSLIRDGKIKVIKKLVNLKFWCKNNGKSEKCSSIKKPMAVGINPENRVK